MFRGFCLGVALAAAVVGGVRAESWYVIAATRTGATIMDADSRKSDQGVYVTTRVVHPGIREFQGIPIIASQFRGEFDCKASRFRTVEFAAIDLDGHISPSLSTNKIRDWDAVEEGTPAGVIKRYACDGILPAKAGGPYKDFTDFEAKFLMWVGDKTPELEGPQSNEPGHSGSP
jgi:hypothetical protein